MELTRARGFRVIVTSLILSLVIFSGAVSAASTEITMVRYAADGVTILAQRTVDYRWMEANLPVMGDGTTHYFLQGPVFVDDPDPEREAELRWNPEEDTNVQEKDMGAVKGTNLKDLCDLVGGISPGEVLRIVAVDGFRKDFAYENVYEYGSRQGPMVVTWWHPAYGYVPHYQDGMRLIFFADTSTNPWGIHAMGVWDWHESAEEKYWYYYVSGNEYYPTTTGLSVRYISRIEILSDDEPCGNLTVTSTPSGADIFLDDDSTGFSTPYTFACLPEGSYLVRVEQEGYLPSREEWAEVYHSDEARVNFILAKEGIPVPVGYSSSDGVSEEGAVSEVHQLAPVATGIPVRVEVTRAEGEVILLTGDADAEYRTNLASSRESTAPLPRLYVFYGNSTRNIPPRVTLNGELVNPLIVYGGGDDDSRGSGTLVFDLTSIPGGDLTVTISPGERDSPCLVHPPLLVSSVEDPSCRTWILEGYDRVTVMDQGLRSDPGNTTSLMFDGVMPGAASARFTLYSVLPQEMETPTPVLLMNGMPVPGQPAIRQDTLLANDFLVPEVPEQSTIAEVSWNGPRADHAFIESRLAIMTLSYPVWNVTPRTLEPDSRLKPTAITTGTPPVDAALPAEVGPEKKQSIPESVIGGFWELVFWLSSLFSPGMVHDTHAVQSVQDPTPQPMTLLHEPGGNGYLLEIRVVPEGASLSVNGTPLENQTPSTVVLPGGVHIITAEQDGYLGCTTRVAVDGPGVITLELVPERDTDGATFAEEPDVHYGGLFVTSYPRGVTLTIDNKKVDGKTPVVLNGVKRGSHLLKATRVLENGATEVSITERVWVSAGEMHPVTFDFICPDIPRQIRIEVPGAEHQAFTVNGRYPVLQAPVVLDLSKPDAFITLIDGGRFLSFTIPNGLPDGASFGIPSYEGAWYSLRVETKPSGAMVFVDGIRTESETPAVITGLSEGTHRISVYLPGFLPAERIITAARDDEAIIAEPVQFLLDTYPSGPLQVESIPAGAWITIDGIPTGEKTPFSFEHLPIGVHELTLDSGSLHKSRDITIRPDYANRYVVSME